MTHKVFATLVLLLASGAVFAQSTISEFITGTVLDPSRAVIRGAAVTLQDPATSKMLTASTNDVGVFHFDYVPPGTYALSVSATGFNAFRETVTATVGQSTTANVQLAVPAHTTTRS